MINCQHALVAFGRLPWADASAGVGKGLDVYLFLTGMMLIAELPLSHGGSWMLS